MIDISKGRFWDLPLSLVSGCTRCSPGCANCWSLAMEKRFRFVYRRGECLFLDPACGGERINDTRILTHPERLSIPLKRRKPTVYAILNDLHHEKVPMEFRVDAYSVMFGCIQHTYLVLTKRPEEMLRYFKENTLPEYSGHDHIWHGLTVCNQQEADEKIRVFLQVPGWKILSIEPMLSGMNIEVYLEHYRRGNDTEPSSLDAVILGGETGPGARPIKIEWVRFVRDQCQNAGIPFFFKSFGKYPPFGNYRLLDGRTHDELPWIKTEKKG